MRLGLALSGGGFRAMAFGLGALRALHDRDLLSSVRVVSGISGGSILTAMWAYLPGDFDAFDQRVRSMLRKGLQAELLRRVVTPMSLGKSLAAAASDFRAKRLRSFSRTEALVDALRARGLDLPMGSVARPDLDVVISATDLSTSNAVRFGSRLSASSPLGQITSEVCVADAVAASAAFPILLPALVRDYSFQPNSGEATTRRLRMTDGGVYDNLGVTPILPGRSLEYTSHVYEIDGIIAVDSGRGRFERRPADRLPKRLAQTLEISHGRVQDGGRAMLHERAHRMKGVVHVYLGSRDDRLPPIADLVPRASIADYPTDFASMTASALEALSVRGEQITRALVARHLSL